MKFPSSVFIALSTIFLLFSCSSPLEDNVPDNEVKELKLSISNDGNNIWETDEKDIEFEIIEGNGEYVAIVSATDEEEDAKVEIAGNKVLVNFLTNNVVELTITDKEQQSMYISIKSTDESLHVPSFGLGIAEGQTYIMDDLEFGDGAPYSIEKIKGNASVASMENGNIKVTSRGLGNTFYKVRDRRGTVAKLEVSTILQAVFQGDDLNLEGVNMMSATVDLPKDKQWEKISSTEKAIENAHVARPKDVAGSLIDHDVLFIETSDDRKGSDTITLRSDDNEWAVIKIWVR